MNTKAAVASLNLPTQFALLQAIRLHWAEYLIEAWALCMFMVSASVFTTMLNAPQAWLTHAIANPLLRTAFIGLAMGSTAVALIYSSWGKRSGAHMNPAVTLSFLSLGRISPINALLYIVAQFVGGYAGVLAAWLLLGPSFALTPVHFIVTVPGPDGVGAAFGAESIISFGMMFAILTVSNSRWPTATGLVAGILIACYVTFESPISGMSMNPARTLASALPADTWAGWWIYFTAPCLGMFLAARMFHVLTPWVARRHHLAKLIPHA